MNIEEIREYCISKKGVTESFPFDETALVFKVANKMFALTNIEGEIKISLKCNPEIAINLREKHSFIIGAYHFNKKHWNSIYVQQATDSLIKEQVDNSYNLVFKSLTKKIQTEVLKK